MSDKGFPLHLGSQFVERALEQTDQHSNQEGNRRMAYLLLQYSMGYSSETFTLSHKTTRKETNQSLQVARYSI